jgi:hypothetical protein
MELCRRMRLSSCFRAWRSLTPSDVNKQLKRLLEKAEEAAESSAGVSSATSQKTRAFSAGAGGSGDVTASSMLAAESHGLARERKERIRRAKSSSAAAATGWDDDWGGDEEEDADSADDEEGHVMTTADILEERRQQMAAGVGGSSSSREKENFMDFDFACESNGPVAPKSTARDLRAAADRKARWGCTSRMQLAHSLQAPGFNP